MEQESFHDNPRLGTESKPAVGEGERKEPEIEAKKKKEHIMRVIRLQGHHLTDPDKGMLKLYKKTSETIKRMERADSDRFVAAILSDIKNWGHELVPRYEHDYFLDSVRVGLKKPGVSAALGNLRGLHTGDLTEQDFREGLVKDNEPEWLEEYKAQQKEVDTLDGMNGRSVDDFIAEEEGSFGNRENGFKGNTRGFKANKANFKNKARGVYRGKE